VDATTIVIRVEPNIARATKTYDMTVQRGNTTTRVRHEVPAYFRDEIPEGLVVRQMVRKIAREYENDLLAAIEGAL
jgi:hypothetical protein